MISNAMWPSAAVCTVASVHEDRSHDVPNARLVVDDQDSPHAMVSRRAPRYLELDPSACMSWASAAVASIS